MSYYFKCRECGAEFDEPYRYVETHGFTYGPFEHFSECPYCGSGDFDESYIVEREAELAAEEEDNDE